MGVTQRAVARRNGEEIGGYLDLRWHELLAELGGQALQIPPVTRAAIALVEATRPQAIVFSGGNDLARLTGATDAFPQRDAMEAALLKLVEKERVPLVGICRGAQFIARSFAAELALAADHAGTCHEILPVTEDDTFPAGLHVGSYHRWAIRSVGLPDALVPVARAPDGTIEAFRVAQRAVWGFMWHPERETQRSVGREVFIRTLRCALCMQ